MKYTIKRKERYQKSLEKGILEKLILTKDEIKILEEHHKREAERNRLYKEINRRNRQIDHMEEYLEKAKNETEEELIRNYRKWLIDEIEYIEREELIYT